MKAQRTHAPWPCYEVEFPDGQKVTIQGNKEEPTAHIVHCVNEFPNFIVVLRDVLDEIKNGRHEEKTIKRIQGLLDRAEKEALSSVQ